VLAPAPIPGDHHELRAIARGVPRPPFRHQGECEAVRSVQKYMQLSPQMDDK
jgi:hypothetical protein